MASFPWIILVSTQRLAKLLPSCQVSSSAETNWQNQRAIWLNFLKAIFKLLYRHYPFPILFCSPILKQPGSLITTSAMARATIDNRTAMVFMAFSASAVSIASVCNTQNVTPQEACPRMKGDKALEKERSWVPVLLLCLLTLWWSTRTFKLLPNRCSACGLCLNKGKLRTSNHACKNFLKIIFLAPATCTGVTKVGQFHSGAMEIVRRRRDLMCEKGALPIN